MKTYQQLRFILFSLLLISMLPNSYGQFSCMHPDEEEVEQDHQALPLACLNSNNYQTQIGQYADVNPNMNLKVNFHFIQKADGSDNFKATVPAGTNEITGNQFVNEIISAANSLLQNNQAMSYAGQASPPVLPIKMSLQLATDPNDPASTGVYYWQAPDVHHYYCSQGTAGNPTCPLPGTTPGNWGPYQNLYSVQNGNVINVYFVEYADLNYISGGGIAQGIGNGDKVKMVNSWRIMELNNFNSPGVSRNAAALLLHEIGHLVGLSHSWYSWDCYDTPGPLGGGNNIMDYGGGQNAWTPCQIGIAHRVMTSNLPAYVDNSSYCIYDQSKTITVPSGDDIVWNGSRLIAGDVIIESGAKLTIICKVSMAKGAKIIVRPGGQLIVDEGWITNVCGDFWKGIEVEGDKNSHQFVDAQGNYLQGYVELKNGAIIEHARDAVWLADGGILVATDTEFNNNRRSVAFLQYENFQPTTGGIVSNASNFISCNFTVDDDYRGINDFFGHVTMWDVSGVDFRACNFRNETTDTNGSPTKLGRAIHTVDAQFNVYPLCGQPGCPPSSITPSTFHNFHRAIEATQSGTNKSFNVRYAEFTNNWFGIYAHNVNLFTCVGSNFDLGTNKIYSNLQNQTGIYTQGGHGFKIHENTFAGIGNQSLTTGVHIENTGTSNTRVYKNTFTRDLYRGIYAKGHNFDHTYSTFTGLDFRCNNFQDNILLDIFTEQATSEDLMSISGIRTNQGSPIASAGNCFSPYFGQSEHDLKSDNSFHVFDYWHEEEDCKIPQEFTVNSIFPMPTTAANSCPTSDLIEEEGGITDGLIGEYEAMFHENMDSYLAYRAIYEENPAENGEYSAYAAEYFTTASTIAEDFIDYYNSHSDGRDFHGMETWLGICPTKEFQYNLLKNFLEQDKLDQASSLLNQSAEWYAETPQVWESTQLLNTLWIQLKAEGRTIAECSEEEVNMLHGIAQNGKYAAAAEARGILNFFYDGQYLIEEVAILETEFLTTAVTDTPTAISNIYPNPFSDMLSITFSEEAIMDGLINIYNLSGQKVRSVSFEEGLSVIQLDLADLTSGLYLIQLNLNGEVLTSRVIKN